MKGNNYISMQDIDVCTVNRDELVDISTVRININDSPEKKLKDFIKQIKNPYCFLSNGYVVKVKYTDNGRTIKDCLADVIDTFFPNNT